MSVLRRATLVCLAMVFAGVLPVLATAATTLSLSFYSPTVAHVEVTYDASTAPQSYSQRLETRSADGQTIVLATFTEPGSYTRSVRVPDLDPGRGHYFGVSSISSADDDTWQTEQSTSSTTGRIVGELLFDETLELGRSDVFYFSIIVPEDIVLVLDILDPNGGAQIDLYGDLVVPIDTPLPALGIIYNYPVSLTPPPGSRLTFRAGSSGSELSGVDNCRISTEGANLKITDSAYFDFSATSTRCELEIENCEFPDNYGVTFALNGKITLRDIQEGMITLRGDGTFTVEESHLTSLTVDMTDGLHDISDTMIERGYTVRGKVHCSATSIDVLGQTFIDPATDSLSGQYVSISNSTLSSLQLVSPILATINDNVFHDAIRLGNVGWPGGFAPDISGNSFFGMQAITVVGGGTDGIPYNIGPNYYGDYQGPKKGTGFMEQRGASVQTTYDGTTLLELDPPLDSGPYRVVYERFPRFWSGGVIAGQNTIAHVGFTPIVALSNRETLLSVEILCDQAYVSGVAPWLMLEDGSRVEAENWGGTLYRDSKSAARGDEVHDSRTVNFIIPPANDQHLTRRYVEVLLDVSGVTQFDMTGYSANPNLSIVQHNFPVAPAVSQRKWRIAVAPIEISYILSKDGPPDPVIYSQKTKQILAAMLPVRSQDIEMVELPAVGMRSLIGSDYLPTAMIMKTIQGLSASEYISLAQGDDDPPADHLIALFPAGSLGGDVRGANWWWDRDISVIEETAPRVTVHEIGHSVGLHTEDEQYDLNPETGYPFNYHTAFIPEDGLIEARFSGVYSGTGRIFHRHLDPASNSADDWVDVMGNNYTQSWPISSTLYVFFTDMYHKLYYPANKSEEATKQRVCEQGQPPSAVSKRLLLQGMLLRQNNPDSTPIYTLNESTFQVMDITPIAQAALAPVNTEAAPIQLMVEYGRPNGDIPVFSINALPAEETTNEVEYWVQTIDINSDAEYLKIYYPGQQDTPLLHRVANTDLGINITVPATIGETETQVSWTLSGVNGTPVITLLSYSRDGGQGWRVFDIVENRQEATLPSYVFNEGDNVQLRALVTDGFFSAIDTVTGLTVSNRAPYIVIQAPGEGAVIGSGVPINLAGFVTDLDEDEITSVSWSSNLDGELGVEESLDDVLLSDGTHLLTLSATDSEGNQSTQSITVNVGEIIEYDFALERGDLFVYNQNVDPVGSGIAKLVEDAENRFDLSFQNIATTSTLELGLAITEPGGSTETILVQNVLSVIPQELYVATVRYTPATNGIYTLRGWISPQSPTDPNPANNSYTWQLSTEAYPPRVLASAEVLDFGGIPLNSIRQQTLTLSNIGEAELLITGAEIVGRDAADFLIETSTGNFSVGTGQEVDITLRHTANVPGAREATLRLFTNDPEKGIIEIPLRSMVQDESFPTGWQLI